MRTRFIISSFSLFLIFTACKTRNDKIDKVVDDAIIPSKQGADNNTYTSPCCWSLTSSYNDFKDCLNSKFKWIRYDSTFTDTLYYKNNRVIIRNIEKDSCIKLMYNSGSISYFGACRTDFIECQNTMYSRSNDSLIILKRNDNSYDSLYNTAANRYTYAGYISDLNYHVVRSSGYESCSFIIMKVPEVVINTPYNHGFTINNKCNYYLEYMQNAYELGHFTVYKLENDTTQKIGSYYQDSMQNYYWDFKVAYWISDNKLAAIIGKDNKPGEYYYCVIIEIEMQNSN